MDKDLFVKNVQMICVQKGIRPTNACKESGVGGSFLSDIKNRGNIPSVAKVQQLASYLGVTVSELLGEEKAPAKDSNGELDKGDVLAAFLGGDVNLPPEKLDALWADVEEYAQFKAAQWKKRNEE